MKTLFETVSIYRIFGIPLDECGSVFFYCCIQNTLNSLAGIEYTSLPG